MTRERWARVRTIFEGALEQPVEARTEWVRRACQGDEPLVREVWGLLRSHDTAGDFLERPAHLDAFAARVTEDLWGAIEEEMEW